MDKVALLELGLTSIRLTLCMVKDGAYYTTYKQISEQIAIDEHIANDSLINSTKIKECVTILQMYKKICESEGVSRYLAVACETLTWAKNYQSFVDECGTAIGLDFKILTSQDEVNAIYTAVTNTLDTPKGIIVNITGNSVRVIHYNRRIVLDSATFDLGSSSLFRKVGEDGDVVTKGIEFFRDQLTKKAPFLATLDPEATIVGVGDVFTSYGRLARKISKSGLEMEHNYTTDSDMFNRVFEFLKTLDPEKRQKLKGISDQPVSNILAGLAIISAILEYTRVQNIVVGKSYRNVGLMFNYALPHTLERPIADILGFSLDSVIDTVGLNKKLSEQMYQVGLMLFKQLKVLHKLPRGYAKVLRIAAHLYQIGRKLNAINPERGNFHAIMLSPIMGCTHKDIVLAAFVASVKRWEDFDLAQWLRYKDIMTEDDLDAVRKLSNILAISEALNIRNQEIVKDISCDILGDSVILKLITETDTKNIKVDPYAAYIEIYYAKKYCGEFNKSFKKNLEIL
ncbi:MAG: hypothetical protein FWE38_01585 [Firmicutes bacterium]|nr:hypothetical protein [Bacillota bacterium]